MAADKYFTVLDEPETDVTAGASEKPSAEFWLRIYAKDAEGASKLPYDQAIDTMPLLKGNSDFARKNNKFLKALFKQCKEHLKPGEESEALTLTVKVYRKSNDVTTDDEDDDDEEMSFFS